MNDVVILAKYSETINLVVKGYFILLFGRRNTPRACFLRAHSATLDRMPEWVWAPEREMTGWELGGRQELLPENEHDGRDVEPDYF